MVQIESLLTELCALQVIVHGLGTLRVGLSLLVKAIQRAKFCVILWVRACTCASVKNEIGKQLCFLRLPNRKYKNLEFSNAVNS